MVFPQPAAPDNKYDLFLSNPPPHNSSKPSIPVGTRFDSPFSVFIFFLSAMKFNLDIIFFHYINTYSSYTYNCEALIIKYCRPGINSGRKNPRNKEQRKILISFTPPPLPHSYPS